MQIVLIPFLSFCLSAAFVGCLIPIGNRFGLIDVPSAHRAHQGATPLVGGIAMYCAIAASNGLMHGIHGFGFSDSVLIACGLLVGMGILDDRYQLSVRIRMTLEVCAALLVISYDGTIVRSLGSLLNSHPFDLGIFAVPFTVFSMVGAINAMNMMDGLDGLAGMVALAVFLLMAVVSVLAGLTPLFSLLLCLIGVTAGFLLYNFRFDDNKRASVFLGDAGSTLLGFLIAVLLVDLSRNGADYFHPVTALWLFALPLYDTLGVMVRRVWLNQSPFKADRSHLHHILLDVGFRIRHVVLILFALQAGFGLIGLAGVLAGISDAVMFYLFVAGWLLYLSVFISPGRVVPGFQKFHQHISLSGHRTRRVFIGNLPTGQTPALATACELLGRYLSNTFHLFIKIDRDGTVLSCCCIIKTGVDDIDALLCYLQERNSGALVIREYRVRQRKRLLPALARWLRQLMRRPPAEWKWRSARTHLIYSSVRDSIHKEYHLQPMPDECAEPEQPAWD